MEERREDSFRDIKKHFSMLNNVVGQEECKEHGQTYNLIETPGGIVGSCPDCFKKQIKQEDEQAKVKAVESQKGWQVPFIVKNEHVSSDLLEAKVSTYKPSHESQQKAKNMVIDYIKTFNGERSLVLSGRSGNGKSHLAYAIAKVVRQQGYTSWFIKSRDVLELIKSTYQHGSQLTEERILKVAETVDLLVLDDIGSEYVKPIDNGNESWSSDILYAILESRLNKSTVCTTNYTEAELEKKYGYNGERIVSRMMDKSKAVRLQGNDHRREERF